MNTNATRWGLVAAILASGALRAAEPKAYRVRGEVREERPEKLQLIVKHEAIPGYMEAMVMPFTVRDRRLFEKVTPGDLVIFTLKAGGAGDWIEDIQVTGRALRAAERAGKAIRAVKPGERLALEGIELVGESGRTLRPAELNQGPLALTFLFTQCPIQEMCPLLAKKLSEVHRILARVEPSPRCAKLLCVTIDPANDTPERLKKYAALHGANPAIWRFATGELPAITRLALQCGANFWDNSGLINHEIRTIVLAPGGRVKRIYSDNDWSPEQLAKELRSLEAK